MVAVMEATYACSNYLTMMYYKSNVFFIVHVPEIAML
jgi:hypothetical protein